jgi:hypothetical protein
MNHRLLFCRLSLPVLQQWRFCTPQKLVVTLYTKEALSVALFCAILLTR